MLQRVVAVKNPLYANVLEVTASLITSFGARAFSSIGGGGDQKYLCFGAIAQSSIAMILPGYTVLTGSLELQSRSITAGSTRLFYALIYSMLLGYGMNIGSQLWATFYPDAPTSATCPRGINDGWKILLVPSYLVVQALLLHSRPHQIPIQVFIGSTAYAVNCKSKIPLHALILVSSDAKLDSGADRPTCDPLCLHSCPCVKTLRSVLDDICRPARVYTN